MRLSNLFYVIFKSIQDLVIYYKNGHSDIVSAKNSYGFWASINPADPLALGSQETIYLLAYGSIFEISAYTFNIMSSSLKVRKTHKSVTWAEITFTENRLAPLKLSWKILLRRIGRIEAGAQADALLSTRLPVSRYIMTSHSRVGKYGGGV